jgi:hypothetical protein
MNAESQVVDNRALLQDSPLEVGGRRATEMERDPLEQLGTSSSGSRPVASCRAPRSAARESRSTLRDPPWENRGHRKECRDRHRRGCGKFAVGAYDSPSLLED